MKKFTAGIAQFMAVLLMLSLCSCGNSKGEEIEQTTIIANKDESITGIEVDVFDVDAYNLDELRTMTNDAVSMYGEGVSLKSLEQKEDTVKMVMNYASAEDFVKFNAPLTRSITLFYGTVSQARKEGYRITDMTSVSDGSTLENDKWMEMEKEHILISSEPVHFQVPGKILYLSSGMEMGKNKYEASVTNESAELYMLISK